MYWSPAAISVRSQLHPNPPQREAIEDLFSRMLRLKHAADNENGAEGENDVSSEDLKAYYVRKSDLGDRFESAAALVQRTAYCAFFGIIPVYGTKRDALLRYLYHLFSSSHLSAEPSSSDPHSRTSFREKKVAIYFVDDQDRYLRDVEEYRSSNFLASMRRECPEFCDFVDQNVSVKTFLMHPFIPRLPSDERMIGSEEEEEEER